MVTSLKFRSEGLRAEVSDEIAKQSVALQLDPRPGFQVPTI